MISDDAQKAIKGYVFAASPLDQYTSMRQKRLTFAHLWTGRDMQMASVQCYN